MAAVDVLLQRLRALDRAVDALSESNFKEIEIQDHLIRGISVNGLICLEGFFADRMAEWVAGIGTARVPPTRLPGGTKKYEDRVVEVLPRNLRNCDVSQRSQLLEDVGRSLTSLSSGVLVPHVLAFSWPGSNIQANDIESIVSMIGIDRNKAWGELTSAWSRVDNQFPGNTSLKGVFEELAELRHAGAHSGSLNIPLPNIITISRNVKLVCLCVDVVVSRGLNAIYGGGSKLTAMPPFGVRKIVKDRNRWPEYPPGRNRAIRRHLTRDAAMQGAISRARGRDELVLILDDTDVLLDWSVPSV